MNCVELPNIIIGSKNLEKTFLDFSQVIRSKYGGTAIHGSSTDMQNVVGIILNTNMTISSGTLDFRWNNMNRIAIITLFNSLPTVDADRVLNIVGCTGAADLTPDDIQIATDKGWTVTR